MTVTQYMHRPPRRRRIRRFLEIAGNGMGRGMLEALVISVVSSWVKEYGWAVGWVSLSMGHGWDRLKGLTHRPGNQGQNI